MQVSAKAFVLIETEVGKTSEAVITLKQTEGVKTADAVTGPYDVIAVVEGERLDEIGNIVTEKIQRVPGVSRIITCLAILSEY